MEDKVARQCLWPTSDRDWPSLLSVCQLIDVSVCPRSPPPPPHPRPSSIPLSKRLSLDIKRPRQLRDGLIRTNQVNSKQLFNSLFFFFSIFSFQILNRAVWRFGLMKLMRIRSLITCHFILEQKWDRAGGGGGGLVNLEKTTATKTGKADVCQTDFLAAHEHATLWSDLLHWGFEHRTFWITLGSGLKFLRPPKTIIWPTPLGF